MANSIALQEQEEEEDKTYYEKYNITSALYEWYIQQENLHLIHSSKHRSHFCLLMLIQKAILGELQEHSQDRDSFVLSDKYKDAIVCNSTSFNELLNFYFDNTVIGEHTGKKIYANGYRLKDSVIDKVFDIMLKAFEANHTFDYVEILQDDYCLTELYITKQGCIVETKKEALKLDGLTRREESKLNKVERNILKKKKVNVYKTDFHKPKGYSEYPIQINKANLLKLIKEKALDKLRLLSNEV